MSVCKHDKREWDSVMRCLTCEGEQHALAEELAEALETVVSMPQVVEVLAPRESMGSFLAISDVLLGRARAAGLLEGEQE